MLTDTIMKDLKVITFKLDKNVIKEFREMCKKHRVKQVSVIEKAMIKAIEELKEKEADENK